jgi:hypothetical protein
MGQRSNKYIVPLGYFRGEPEREPDEAWRFIHEERVRIGLSTQDLSELADVDAGSISKGERGGFMTLRVTRKVLQALGYNLKLEKIDG